MFRGIKRTGIDGAPVKWNAECILSSCCSFEGHLNCDSSGFGSWEGVGKSKACRDGEYFRELHFETCTVLFLLINGLEVWLSLN